MKNNLAPALLFLLAGCSNPPVADNANPDPVCQPIATGNCFLPYPSAFYEKKDATSETGWRLAIPKGALPKNQVREDFDPVRYNLLPGWSLSSQIVADLGVIVDSSKLVGERGDWDATTKPDSLTQIIEFDTGARVAHFAEIDANEQDLKVQDPGRVDELKAAWHRALLLHPMTRLKPATRYVVVLQKLAGKDGKPVVVKPFRDLVDGTFPPASRLAGEKVRYDEILGLLDKQGVSRADLTLAWDFVTGSDKQSWQNLVTMRDKGFARWAKDGLGVKVTASRDVMGDDNMIRTIEGTFEVPSFLADPANDFSPMSLDAQGNPVDSGKNFTASVLINVPKCVEKATLPIPILVYGHGNFGSRDEINGGDDKLTMNTLCMVEIATDWTGQADGDEARFAARASSFDKVAFLFDRMQQGQLNTLVLARLARTKLAALPELQWMGKPIVDGKEVYYYGNSQGGIYGQTFLTVSPDVQKGVFGVGAANYSVMIWRSRDFEAEKLVMDYLYPNLVEQQILWMVGQNLWDRVDPFGFVAHTVKDTLPGEDGKPMPAKQVLIQEGRYDMQVPNVATRLGVRTQGIPLLGPSVEKVWQVEEKMGPLDSAYTQWDVHAAPLPPATNAPTDKGDAMGKEPRGSTGQTVHEAVRRLPQAVEMMKRFLKPGGKVENTCGGACDFPVK